MTDHSSSHFNVQLYQEMLTRFPTASPDLIRTVITKYNGNIQRCIEDLTSIICSSQVNTTAPVSPNLRLPRNNFPPDMNQRQPPSSTSTRSHSVSGVPDCDPRNYYSYGYPGVRQRLPVPQTAPVLASPNHPILGVGFSFPTNSVNSNHRDIGIRNAFMPVAETPKPSSLPKPPVPPPTYRLYQQQMNLPGQATSGTTTRVEQQNSLYPKLSNESFNDFSLRPPRHMTSLNIVPVHPQMPGGNFCVPRGDTSPPPPPYGWATKPALHSTSVNFQLGAPNTRTPELHITTTTGNTNCTGSRLYGYNVLSPVGQTSPGSNVPYQSKVQISISPTGGCFSTGRSPLSSHSPTRFPPTSGTPTMERRSPVGVGYNGRFPSPTPSNQTSPSQINFQSPSVCQEENMYGPQSIFDQPDPEIEKLSHAPLKPLPSTHIITANIPDWNAEPGWSVCPVTAGGFAPHHELCSGEAYLQGLIEHQRQKFTVLTAELEKEKLQLEAIRGEVANKEEYYFRCQVSFPDSLFFTYKDLEILRAEVRSLMVDCECMTRLVDLLHKGQVPLGETNEDFYKSINTGQQGPVLLISKTDQQVVPPLLTFHQSGQQSALLRSFRPLPPQPPTTPPQQQRRLSSPTLVVARPNASRPLATQDDDYDEDQKWTCCICTFRNAAAMEMCEMCEMPKFIQATSMNNQSGTLPFIN